MAKLIRCVSLCNAEFCLEHSEALKGLNLQTAFTGLPWISAKALPEAEMQMPSLAVGTEGQKS